MKIITFSGIKGGIGKSSLCILTANYLASAGKKVIVLDMDIQNSTSFFYLPNYEGHQNIARALSSNDLKDNIVKGDLFVDIIPSAFNLIDLRAISINTLKRIIHQIEYDACLIDCAPTLDNLVLNAVQAADLIITPVLFSLFDLKSALFYRDKLGSETDKVNSWKILFNKYRDPRTNNPESEHNQYINLFESNFSNILKTRIPDTSLVQKAIDQKISINQAKTKEKLFTAIQSLSDEIMELA